MSRVLNVAKIAIWIAWFRYQKSRVLNVARKSNFKSRGYLMSRKRQKLQKTVLNVAKVVRKNSRHLVLGTFSTRDIFYHWRRFKNVEVLPPLYKSPQSSQGAQFETNMKDSLWQTLWSHMFLSSWFIPTSEVFWDYLIIFQHDKTFHCSNTMSSYLDHISHIYDHIDLFWHSLTMNSVSRCYD